MIVKKEQRKIDLNKLAESMNTNQTAALCQKLDEWMRNRLTSNDSS